VYEETSGIRPGEPVADTGKPLTVELAPDCSAASTTGAAPAPGLQHVMGDFILRGVERRVLSREKQWGFKPAVEEGQGCAWPGPGPVQRRRTSSIASSSLPT